MTRSLKLWRILTLGLIALTVVTAGATNRPEDPRISLAKQLKPSVILDDGTATGGTAQTRSLGSAAAAIDSRGALVAQTWRDWQTNSTLGRTVDVNPPASGFPVVQFTFMQKVSADPLAYSRWEWIPYEAVTGTYLTCMVPEGCLFFPDYSVYPKIAVNQTGTAYLAGFDRPAYPDSQYSRLRVTRDAGPVVGDFGGPLDGSIMDEAARNQQSFETGTETLWPVMDISEFGGQTTVYLAAYENVEGAFGAMKVYRKVGWSEANPDNSWELVFVDSAWFPSQDIACDRTSGKVAVTWTKYSAAGHSSLDAFDSDLWYAESTAGETGTWSRVNVTNYSGAGYRAWMETSALYDSQGKLHLVWPASKTDGVDFGGHACRILHWSQWNQSNIYTVYLAEWDPTQLNCTSRSNSLNVARVSVAECNDRLFVVFSSFNDPATGHNDDCCTSAGVKGANGEIFASVSSDLQGRAWDLSRNLSGSYSPGCDTGTCADDRLLGVSRFGMDEADYTDNNWSNSVTYAMDGGTPGSEFLQVWYQTDRYPGGGALSTPEGPLTNNDMRWIRLACNPAPLCGLSTTPDNIATFLPYEGHGDYPVTLFNVCSATNPITSVEIIDGAGWLTVSNVPVSIPAGDSAAILVRINENVTVHGPDVKRGTVIVHYGPGIDTKRIEVETIFGSCCIGKRGDINMDGRIDLSDLTCLIGTILQIYPLPMCRCEEAKNVNGTGRYDLSDLSLMIAYLTVTPRPTLPDCPIIY